MAATIRHLFGFDVPLDEIPEDGSISTFDTVGSEQFFSSVHFEKYLALGRKIADPASGQAMDARLLSARWFMERRMPETALRVARITSGACTMMDMPDEAF